MSGYCSDCGGQVCICWEMVMPKPCEHIYGYYDGYADSWNDDFESPCLVEEKDSSDIDVRFTFCPKCGKRLIDE